MSERGMTPTERQRSVLLALEAHPFVAWVTRAPSGTARRGQYRLNLCKAGTPDLVGFLKDGRFLGVEVKSSEQAKRGGGGSRGDGVRQAQADFARLARDSRTVYGMVISAEEAWELVNQANRGAYTDDRPAVSDRGTTGR